MLRVERLPRVLLRIEGVAMLAGAVVLYFEAGFSWWLFLALVLVPDVSLAGFAVSQRLGSTMYNATHTSVLPVALAVVGVAVENDVLVQVGLVWLAHIGVDRALGLGLRYPTGRDTHLQRV
jgi:hypothetical protein